MKTTFYITYTSEPDSLGRRRFELEWLSHGQEDNTLPSGGLGPSRGEKAEVLQSQHFFAVPDHHIAALESEGWTVVEGRQPPPYFSRAPGKDGQEIVGWVTA